jgi:hypothetical protein
VKNESSAKIVSECEELRQVLAGLREGLLDLHKALIESERSGYEKTFGKITSSYQFLQLLTSDSWFAWLRPLSRIITEMDEVLDAKKALTASSVKNLTNQAKSMLVAASGGNGFSGHYDEVLQRDSDVLFAHAAVARFLRNSNVLNHGVSENQFSSDPGRPRPGG